MPLYHCFGMVLGNLACVTHGAAMVYPGEGFDAAGRAASRRSENAAPALHGVPTMFIAELDHPRFRATSTSPSLRTGIMAGSPCPIEVMQPRASSDMHMREVTIAYGMTETSPVQFQTAIDDPLERRVSHRRPRPAASGSEDRRRATAASCRAARPASCCTRGYSVMLGYWDDAEKTAEAIDAAGWMHTGDLATIDDEGYCNIVGRIKDMVIRGGENIYPREIEEFLYPPSEDPGRAGVRRAGCEVRRGSLCAWIMLRPGETGERGRDPRLLPRPDRALQGAALRPLRRRVPDDGDRQGAEIHAAADDGRRMNPCPRKPRAASAVQRHHGLAGMRMERRQFLLASMAAAAATAVLRRAAQRIVRNVSGSRMVAAHPRAPQHPAAALETLLAGLDTTALMVIHRGSVIASHGDEAHLSYIASARKSLVSMTYGPAVARGAIDPDVTLQSLGFDDLGGLLPVERTATIRHLLMARSGVYHPAANLGDASDRAPPRGSVRPGSYFLYNNWDFNALGAIYERLTGRTLYQGFEADIAGPIGMQDWNLGRAGGAQRHAENRRTRRNTSCCRRVTWRAWACSCCVKAAGVRVK